MDLETDLLKSLAFDQTENIEFDEFCTTSKDCATKLQNKNCIKMLDAWQTASVDLKEEVLSWANNDECDARDWILELGNYKIRSCEILEKVARNQDSWAELCHSLSVILRENLRDWRKLMLEKGAIQDQIDDNVMAHTPRIDAPHIQSGGIETQKKQKKLLNFRKY